MVISLLGVTTEVAEQKCSNLYSKYAGLNSFFYPFALLVNQEVFAGIKVGNYLEWRMGLLLVTFSRIALTLVGWN